jgi:hypothetical protein
MNLAMLPFIILFQNFLHILFFIITSIYSALLLLVGSNQAGSLVILCIITGCSGFSLSLGIFMFLLMFLFRSWVHGVFYRFHALKIPTSSFHHRIMDVDGQPRIL